MREGFVIAGLLLLSGCMAREEGDDTAEKADILYARQKVLILAYTDSVRQYSDSASTHRIMENLEAALYAESAKFPQRVTEALTPDQNDTLEILSRRFLSEWQRGQNPAPLDSTLKEEPDRPESEDRASKK